MAESLIDKIRELNETYQEHGTSMVGFEEASFKMAQALIAVDEVLKKYESILQPLKIKNNMKDEMCQEIRKAIESTKGGSRENDKSGI